MSNDSPLKKLPNLNTMFICTACFPGELDHVPEVAFYMVGDISEVLAKADKLAEEHAAQS